MEIPFQEDDGRLFTRLGLENVEVQVVAWGYPDDLAKVIVRLPVRAAMKHRAAAGDFLHRLNCNARRKYWEMDCDSGEMIPRLATGSLKIRTFEFVPCGAPCYLRIHTLGS